MIISFTHYSAPQASCNSPSNSWSMILSFLNMFYDLVSVVLVLVIMVMEVHIIPE